MKPILFSTPMVKAILEGRKSQTRRVVKRYGRTPEQYGRDKFYKLVNELNGKQGLFAGFYKDSDVFMYEGQQHIDAVYFKAPYPPGDAIYVQETWKAISADLSNFEILIEYKADGFWQWARFTPERFAIFRKYALKNGWQSPYFMPKEAARLFLMVKDVRIGMVQEITEEDVVREGIPPRFKVKDRFSYDIARQRFLELWDSINGKKYPWDTNPWVWTNSFERTDKPEGVILP